MSGNPPTPSTPSAPKHLRWQSKVLFAVAAILVLGVFFYPQGDDDEAAPNGPLVTAAGAEFEFESLLKPVTLVHFWSTWCPPCIVETPAIQRLAADYGGRPDFDLVMVAVADDHDAVGEFLGQREDSFYDDDWKLAKKFGTDKLPETHLIVDGRVVRSFIGATDWDAPAVRKSIDEALATAGRG
ncbi:MAG: TlpA disulfide reductase family protein [Acidobacteriota bacterium]